MTTLYRPVLIESAEQAEALPEGTTIIHAENYPQEELAGLWGRAGNSSQQLADEEGWSALVPIEAEEEILPGLASCGCDLSVHPTVLHLVDKHPDPPAALHRLVTPWEEA